MRARHYDEWTKHFGFCFVFLFFGTDGGKEKEEELFFLLYLTKAGAGRRECDEKWKPWRILGQRVVGIAILARHGVVVNGLEVVLEFVGPWKLASAHQTWKHFALVAFVVEVGVSLEAVLVFERPRHVLLFARDATVHALLRNGSVAEEVQAANRHLLQLLRVVWIAVIGAAEQSPIRRAWTFPLRRASQIIQRIGR